MTFTACDPQLAAKPSNVTTTGPQPGSPQGRNCPVLASDTPQGPLESPKPTKSIKPGGIFKNPHCTSFCCELFSSIFYTLTFNDLRVRNENAACILTFEDRPKYRTRGLGNRVVEMALIAHPFLIPPSSLMRGWYIYFRRAMCLSKLNAGV
jgi:hypothetical protein